MPGSLWSAIGLGFVLGLKHALEADHVVAVSNLMVRRQSLLRATLVGVAWGAGHSLAVLAVGTAMLVFGLRLPPGFTGAAEALVGVALVLLGLGSVRTWCHRRVHLHAHSHGGTWHSHFHSHGHARPGAGYPGGEHHHSHHWRPGWRPVALGLIHGLAGSGALVLLVLGSFPVPLAGLLYLALFALGSTAGMAAISLAMALPLRLAGGRLVRVARVVALAAGVASVAVGGLLLWETAL